MNTAKASVGKIIAISLILVSAVLSIDPLVSDAASTVTGSFGNEGATPKYGKTWVASITCRQTSGATATFGGSGSPLAVVGAVNQAIDQRGLSVPKPTERFVRSDGGTGGGNRWNDNGTQHGPTLNAICAILGYDAYVSSTCLDEERSGRYPFGKCNFHSPENNALARFSGSIVQVTPTPTPTPTATPTATPTPTPTPTPTATPRPQCSDGIDNDGDGLIDIADPGCSTPNDNNEADGTSQCQDGVDNDGDGAVDFPNDFSCSSKQDNDETFPKAQCQDGIDNDSDGKVDFSSDPGCSSRQDNDEFHVIPTTTPTPTPTPKPTATPTPKPTATPTATPTPTPEPGEAALAVTKSDDHDITRPGHSLTYTITVKNTGDAELHDIKIMDTVPSHLAITNVAPGASTKTGQTVMWEGISLNEGESKEFKITTTVKNNTPHDTVVQNVARVGSDDFDIKESASDKTTVKHTSAPAPVVAGAVHVPITAKTGSGLMSALMSLIGGSGLFITFRRGL